MKRHFPVYGFEISRARFLTHSPFPHEPPFRHFHFDKLRLYVWINQFLGNTSFIYGMDGDLSHSVLLQKSWFLYMCVHYLLTTCFTNVSVRTNET